MGLPDEPFFVPDEVRRFYRGPAPAGATARRGLGGPPRAPSRPANPAERDAYDAAWPVAACPAGRTKLPTFAAG